MDFAVNKQDNNCRDRRRVKKASSPNMEQKNDLKVEIFDDSEIIDDIHSTSDRKSASLASLQGDSSLHSLFDDEKQFYHSDTDILQYRRRYAKKFA